MSDAERVLIQLLQSGFHVTCSTCPEVYHVMAEDDGGNVWNNDAPTLGAALFALRDDLER